MESTPDPSAEPATPPTSSPRVGRMPSRFLFESLLIVISVALGFVVTQWRESVVEGELAARVLADVLVEVEANLGQIDAQMAKHKQVIEDLVAGLPSLDAAAPDQSGLDFIFSHIGGDFSGRPLRQAAWDAAVSSGALRLIDYEIAAVLSDIYVSQEKAYDPLLIQTTSIIFAPSTFDPARRKEVVLMFRWFMEEAVGREKLLKEKYEEYLPQLQRAVASED
jgi:hypothetical protein